jgi:hypothetical protein
MNFLILAIQILSFVFIWRGHIVQPWMLERDLLLQESLAFAQRVAAARPVRVETPPVELRKMDELAQPRARPSERQEIRQRTADFKATQDRFKQEREEYFKNTLAKVQTIFEA